MIAHCLFEQSGTFKREFEKLGIHAIDYDIANDYGETDVTCNLFLESWGGYYGKPSIFDRIQKNDIIMAFFPCTRFEDQITMAFRGDQWQLRRYSDAQKLDYSIRLHEQLSTHYTAISMLAATCLRRGLRLIIENPYSAQHYLTRYWPLKPKIIDNDRRLNWDYYKKPTQYFFINCEPQNNLIVEPVEYVEPRNVERCTNADGKSRKVRRSEISPQYANRFIRRYILEGSK